MTANQTIDGVPRELLEQLVDPVNHIARVKARAELRALLDAPETKNWEYFHNAMESERDYWKALAQKPAAQHQGEPVARVEIGADRNAALTITDENWLRSLKDRGAHQLVPLYAEQRVPVAANSQAMTELRRIFDSNKGHDGTLTISKKLAEKILNPTRPAHGNPPPGTEPSGTHHDNDGLEEWRKP